MGNVAPFLSSSYRRANTLDNACLDRQYANTVSYAAMQLLYGLQQSTQPPQPTQSQRIGFAQTCPM